MEKEYGLTPTNKKNTRNKSNSLKLMGTLSPKRLRKNTLNPKDDKNERPSIKLNYNPNLKKANKNILNFIANCVEKIKDENNEDGEIAPHFTGVIEKRTCLKGNKRSLKKEVHINPNNLRNNRGSNFRRMVSKETIHTKKKYESSQCQIYINKKNSNKLSDSEVSESINSDYEKKARRSIQLLGRMGTTKFPKEKEKEIVYNITSSLITLCKPINMKSSFANYMNNYVINNKNKELDKNKNKIQKISISPVNAKYSKAKTKKFNKRNSNSNEEKYLSNFLDERPSIKKPKHMKKYDTFIKPNNNKCKAKFFKDKRNSFKFQKKYKFF